DRSTTRPRSSLTCQITGSPRLVGPMLRWRSVGSHSTPSGPTSTAATSVLRAASRRSSACWRRWFRASRYREVEKPTSTRARGARKSTSSRAVSVTPSPRLVAEDIAAVAQRVDQAPAVRLQLLAQLHHVDLQRVGRAVVALVPDVLVDARARQHLAGVAQQ